MRYLDWRETDPRRLPALRVLVRLNIHLGLTAYFRMERLVLLQCLIRAMAPAARLGPSRELLEWTALAASVLGILRRGTAAHRMRRQAKSVAREVGSPTSEARARQYSAHAIHFLGEAIAAEEEMVRCLDEWGRYLENHDFFPAAADLGWSTMLRGRPKVGWPWIEAGIRRAALDGEEIPLTEGHTFRCYAGPLLAMLGQVDEGWRHLLSFRRFIQRTPNDLWRWAQWLAHWAQFHLEIASDDEFIEDALERFHALRISPKTLPLQITHVYVVQLRFRIRQLGEASSARDRRLARRRIRTARSQLRSAGRGHPTLRSHLFACDARLAFLEGDRDAALRSVERARQFAEATQNQWVEWEICLLKAELSPSEAGHWHEKAQAIAEDCGWRPTRKSTRGIGLIQRLGCVWQRRSALVRPGDLQNGGRVVGGRAQGLRARPGQGDESVTGYRTMSGANADAIEAWNTILFDKFERFRYVLTAGLRVHSDTAFNRHPAPEGARILDIGSGFGDTTRALAEQVGARGRAIGVDAAPRFVQAATEEVTQAAITNVRFLVADVESDDLEGPYDHAFSRFGTMFFAGPGAAMRNVRRHLAPGGKLTMTVWRKREANLWLHEAEKAVRAIIPEANDASNGKVHCGPGPFSMADADTVGDILVACGFDRVGFERCDADICIGRTFEEAIDFAMMLGPAGQILREAKEAGEERRDEVARSLETTLSRFERDGEIWAPSSSWIVTARNPA